MSLLLQAHWVMLPCPRASLFPGPAQGCSFPTSTHRKAHLPPRRPPAPLPCSHIPLSEKTILILPRSSFCQDRRFAYILILPPLLKRRGPVKPCCIETMPPSASRPFFATGNLVHGKEIAIVRQDLVLLTAIPMERDYLALEGEKPVRKQVGGFDLTHGRTCPKHDMHQRLHFPWR